MASLITHGIVSVILGRAMTAKELIYRFWFWVIICSMLPDVDVLGFLFGIKYGDFWGHRGFTHSLLFAFFTGIVASSIYLKRVSVFKTAWWGWTLFFFTITASHSAFDALTNGGLGVAIFSPFDNGRYFFPFTPVEVSPIGVKEFLSMRGLRVLYSELVWIIVPVSLLLLIVKLIRSKLAL